MKENLDSIATFHEAEINPERTWDIVKGVPKPFIKKINTMETKTKT